MNRNEKINKQLDRLKRADKFYKSYQGEPTLLKLLAAQVRREEQTDAKAKLKKLSDDGK